MLPYKELGLSKQFGEQTYNMKPGCPVTFEDLRCPICLKLLSDPVILATGETYDRVCIQKWIDLGYRTCPKTQQMLQDTKLIPNCVVRSLIEEWFGSNGADLQKRSRNSFGSTFDSCSDQATVNVLLQKLSCGSPMEQKAATAELCLLAKTNADNMICIADGGAIPLLVNLLSTSSDSTAQEHAMTTLLNLSIPENNKVAIVMAGGIGPMVKVLKNGSMEGRETAAAILFSLSAFDENKITIGESGAIPAFVGLLCEGSQRGKKVAATTLFILSIYRDNQARAVRAGAVVPLVQLLIDPSARIVEEVLATLAILAGHPEGIMAIGNAEAIPILIDLIRNGSPRNKENAAAVLLVLCRRDPGYLVAARELGAREPLSDLAQNGTERAKRKASSLMEHMSEPKRLPNS